RGGEEDLDGAVEVLGSARHGDRTGVVDAHGEHEAAADDARRGAVELGAHVAGDLTRVAHPIATVGEPLMVVIGAPLTSAPLAASPIELLAPLIDTSWVPSIVTLLPFRVSASFASTVTFWPSTWTRPWSVMVIWL